MRCRSVMWHGVWLMAAEMANVKWRIVSVAQHHQAASKCGASAAVAWRRK
jgi:hypothetical protein